MVTPTTRNDVITDDNDGVVLRDEPQNTEELSFDELLRRESEQLQEAQTQQNQELDLGGEVVVPDETDDNPDPNTQVSNDGEGELDNWQDLWLEHLLKNEVFHTIDGDVIKAHPEKDNMLQYAFEQEVKNRVDDAIKNRFAGWGDNRIESFIDAINNGADISDYAAVYGQEDYSNVDLKNKTVQEGIIRKNLSLQGFAGESIDQMVNTFKDNDILASQAKEAHRQLMERDTIEKKQFHEQLRLQQMQQEAQYERFLTDLDSFVKTNEKIGDVYFTETDKQMVNYLKDYQPIYMDAEHKQPLIDPDTNQPKMMNSIEFKFHNAKPEQKMALQAIMYKFIMNDFKLDGQDIPIQKKVLKDTEQSLLNSAKYLRTSTKAKRGSTYMTNAEHELIKSSNSFQKNKNRN